MSMKSILGGKKWGGTMLIGVVALLNSVHDMGVSETIMIWVIKLVMVFVLAEAFIDGMHAFGERKEKVKNGNGHAVPPTPPPAPPGGAAK